MYVYLVQYHDTENFDVPCTQFKVFLVRFRSPSHQPSEDHNLYGIRELFVDRDGEQVAEWCLDVIPSAAEQRTKHIAIWLAEMSDDRFGREWNGCSKLLGVASASPRQAGPHLSRYCIYKYPSTSKPQATS
jgi:hypothetical protein